MPCSLKSLVTGAKLIIWEQKSSLSFTELFARCFLPLHLTLLQRPHLRILQRAAVVGWGKTGFSSFPDLLFLLEPTNVTACYEGHLPKWSGTRISESCHLMEPFSPCWPSTEILKKDAAVIGSLSNFWNHSVLNYCNGMFLYILFSEIFIFQRFCTLPDFILFF